MSTVLITGGTGLIGTELTRFLTGKGYNVIILSRSPHEKQGSVSYAMWDVKKQTIDERAIKQADYVVNLAGANISEKRWTSKRKKEIRNSRIQSSTLLVKAITDIPNQMKAVISASAVGWYGDDKFNNSVLSDKSFRENSPPDKGFLGETCRLWEENIQPVKQAGVRLITLRFGIVLAATGGAFKEFKKPLQMGIAAIPGTGRQVMSWIHIQDLCRLILFGIENDKMHGTYNAVAPKPVTLKQLILQMAKRTGGNRYLPMHVPVFVLKILMGEMALEILKSTTVSSTKIQNQGFTFIYPSIESALIELLS